MNKTGPPSLFNNLRCRLCAKQKPCDNRMQNLAHNKNLKISFLEKLKYFGGEFYEFFGNFNNELLPEIVCGACYEGLEASHRFFLHMENAKRIFSKLCKESGQTSDKKSVKTDIKIKSEYISDTPNIKPVNDIQIKIENDITNEYDNDTSVEVNNIKIEASNDTMTEQNGNKSSKCPLLQPLAIKKEPNEPFAGGLVKGSSPVYDVPLQLKSSPAHTSDDDSEMKNSGSDDISDCNEGEDENGPSMTDPSRMPLYGQNMDNQQEVGTSSGSNTASWYQLPLTTSTLSSPPGSDTSSESRDKCQTYWQYISVPPASRSNSALKTSFKSPNEEFTPDAMSNRSKSAKPKKIPKTQAERLREYRLRKKKLKQPKKTPKTAAERQREYRLRKKKLKEAQNANLPKKTRADYQREYRIRQKQAKLNSGSDEMIPRQESGLQTTAWLEPLTEVFEVEVPIAKRKRTKTV